MSEQEKQEDSSESPEGECYTVLFVFVLSLIIVFANNTMFVISGISNMEGTGFVFFFEVCGFVVWFLRFKIRNKIYKGVNLIVFLVTKIYRFWKRGKAEK